MSQKFVFIFANIADPDEMQHNAAFHLGLQCFSQITHSRVSRP